MLVVKVRYKNAAKYAPEGVEFDIDVFSTVGGDTPLSASDIRNKLDNLSVEDLLPYIPDRLRDNKTVVDEVYSLLTNLPSSIN